MAEAFFLPLAHAGHWLWVLYLPPALIVLGSIMRSTISERRRQRNGEKLARGDQRDDEDA